MFGQLQSSITAYPLPLPLSTIIVKIRHTYQRLDAAMRKLRHGLFCNVTLINSLLYLSHTDMRNSTRPIKDMADLPKS